MIRKLLVLAGLLALQSSPTLAGDADKGMAAFVQNCSLCHSVQPGVHKKGPSLAGIFGRAAGSAAGFKYSASLASEDFQWNEATLFEYLSVPTQTGGGDEVLVHGVAMGFEGLGAHSAEDVIAFLRLF